jgi:hypothetical protein
VPALPTGSLRQASVAESGRALACRGRGMSEQQRPKLALKVVDAPMTGAVVTAPPVLIASTHTVDYCCGHCATVLMHAERNQVHNLLIKCTACGAYNSTDL